MRKIIVSIATILTLSSIASLANANGSNVSGGGSSTSANFNSNHTGTVAATCSLDVLDGTLPVGQDFTSSLITTGTLGKISTVCNSPSSNLSVSIVPGTHPTQPNYSESFKLTNGTGAYLTSSMTSFLVSPGTYSKTNLANGYSSSASTLNVLAKASVPPSQVLAAGNYIVNVKVTVTP